MRCDGIGGTLKYREVLEEGVGVGVEEGEVRVVEDEIHWGSVFPSCIFEFMFWEVDERKFLLKTLNLGVWDMNLIFSYLRHCGFRTEAVSVLHLT